MVLLSLLALGAGLGCVRGERSPCPKFVRSLSSPVKAKNALREIGEQKCKMALPKLEEMFDQDKYREDVIRIVKQIGWHPDAIKGEVPATEITWAKQAVSILRKGLTDRNTAAIAASVIQDWRVAEAKDDLIDLLGKDQFVRARNSALQALIEIVSPKEAGKKDNIEGLKSIEDTLIAMLDGDPNKQAIFVNVTAARKLGIIGSTRAIDSLINAVFLRTLKDEKMYQVARRALLQIGTPALDRLIETLEGKNNTLVAYAKSFGILDWEWADSPMLVQVIGDFQNPKAAMALITKQAQPLSMPAGLSEKQANMWRMAQSNRIKVTMLALALIGTDEMVAKAKEIIENPENDIQQRLDTATAIALSGSPAAIEALLEIYKAERDGRFRAPLLLPISIAMDWAHWEAFQKLWKKERSTVVKTYAEQTPQVKDQLAVIEECKDDKACWSTKLDLIDALAAQKAALTLGQLGDKSKGTIDLLFKRFRKAKAAQTDLRRFILASVLRYNAGDEYVFHKLVELWRHNKDLGTSMGKYWASELEMGVLAWKAQFGFDPDKVARVSEEDEKAANKAAKEAAKAKAARAKPAKAEAGAAEAKPAAKPAAAPAAK